MLYVCTSAEHTGASVKVTLDSTHGMSNAASTVGLSFAMPVPKASIVTTWLKPVVGLKSESFVSSPPKSCLLLITQPAGKLVVTIFTWYVPEFKFENKYKPLASVVSVANTALVVAFNN